MTLTADEPVAAQLVNVVLTAANTAGTFSGPSLEAWAGADYAYGGEPSGYSLSIVPTDPTEPIKPVELGFLSLNNGPDLTQDLSKYCAKGCSRSYYIVMRRTITSVDVQAVADVDASAGQTTGSTYSPRVSFVGEPVPVREAAATITGGLDSDFFGSQSWHGTIHIPAAAYSADPGPVLGIISVSGSSRITDYGGAQVRLTVDGVSDIGKTLETGSAAFSFERGWLASCTRGADCTVPVDLDLVWRPNDFLGLWPFTPGHARLNYTITARLDYLGLADVPTGATIELSPK